MEPLRNKQVEVRATQTEDLPALAEIRQHPLVAPQQYRQSRYTTGRMWLARLNSDITTECFTWRSFTILVDATIVGYVSEFCTRSKYETSAQLGWSLHPDYWGRGIMTSALTEMITTMFTNQECDVVIADCFAHNDRCLRLLQRLNFKPAPIGRIERFLTWLVMICPHRIVRHRITSADWQPPPKNTGKQVG